MAGILLCLAVAAWAYFNYRQPRTGVASASADYTLEAAELYNAFATDEKRANETYNGKVVKVQGEVLEVQKEVDHVLIVLKAGEKSGGISCSFSDKVHQQLPSPDEVVNIKGRCTGFLIDVNLVDAMLIQ